MFGGEFCEVDILGEGGGAGDVILVPSALRMGRTSMDGIVPYQII